MLDRRQRKLRDGKHPTNRAESPHIGTFIEPQVCGPRMEDSTSLGVLRSADSPISIRALNALGRANILTIGQARMHSDRSLLMIPNFGERALRWLREQVGPAHGMPVETLPENRRQQERRLERENEVSAFVPDCVPQSPRLGARP